MAGGPTDVTVPRERRPRQVLLVSILLMFFGGLGVLVALFLFGLLRDDASHGRSVSGAAYAAVVAALVLALAQALTGVFVFLGREWARKLAIGICVLNIAASLLSLASGAIFQVVLGVVINIGIIVNLSRYEVVSWMR